MENILLISLGAVFGANARYWLAYWLAQKIGASFPYGTMIVNISGSFLIGLIMALTTEKYLVDPRIRLFFTVGFLGAYTTFSTFTFESYNLFSRGQWLTGLTNLLTSTIIGIIAVGIGVYVGKSL